MNQLQSPLAQRVRALRILWVAFSASLFIYGGVAVLMTAARGAPSEAGALKSFLVAAAVLSGAASFWWKRRAAGETQLKLGNMPPAADDFETLQNNCIIAWAFSEAVGIFGLVLALLSGDVAAYAPFGLAALVLMIAHRPGPSTWPRWPSA